MPMQTDAAPDPARAQRVCVILALFDLPVLLRPVMTTMVTLLRRWEAEE
ncbi:hypothetical protein [Hoyosella subflava]|nr:hypothetical protein [Hoyosella subflava]